MELKEYKLGDLIEVTRGMSLPGEFYSTEGEYIRLTCGNFDYVNNSFKENKSKDDLYYVGKIKPEFIMEKGDIITPLTEQAIGLLGSTAIIPESGKYIQSQDVAKVTCKKGMIDHDFAYYLIPSKCVKEQLSAAAQQTKIRHTSPDAIKACKVFVPPLSEQKKIASVLSALDDKIALNKKMNQKLEAMAKRLYDYWFVQYDFPDKNGHPYKTTGGKMVYNDQLKREIPAGWEVKQICDIAKIFNGSTPSTTEEGNYGGEIVWITPKDLSDQNCKFVYQGARNITQAGYDSCSTTMVPKGTVVMSSRAPIGLLSIAQCDLCTNQGFKNMVPNDMTDSKYLYYTIQQHIPQIQNLGTGTTFKEVSKDELGRFAILYPPKKLIAAFEEKVASIFDVQFNKVKEITRLTALRDKLLPLLMNGQVTIK
ncbi:restriction endonuclease subunit S [uncultured Fibrobacter sp.]|uniref:restriction endonuclease subunit S n=1 Tax=uncultured Fibrobacter sp. TaxID=261512 RepID=UPI0026240BAD|nr:restriction endonuclease subunit S [uncultured Fibrobacter sp.]